MSNNDVMKTGYFKLGGVLGSNKNINSFVSDVKSNTKNLIQYSG